MEKKVDGLELRDAEGACSVKVRVQPGASRNQVVGISAGALRLKIQAPPLDGRANDETRDFLAEILGCSRAKVVLARGERSREKVFRIEGMTSGQIRKIVARTQGEENA